MLFYRVAKKYARGPEQVIDGKFNTPREAKDFINELLQQDAELKVNATYLLYEGNEMIEELDLSKMETSSTAQGQGSQQQSSTQTFRPSPLQTSPRPPGMPPSSFKESDEKKK